MDFNDPCLADEATVRQFIQIISGHATRAINGDGSTGVLQLFRINPFDEKPVASRFQLDDVEHMVRTALSDAAAGHNVYIEARTVRKDLRGNKRGEFEDTVWVLGLVVDSDADKNKGGNVIAKPSLAVETSPGNYHLWYLFDRAIPGAQARVIGEGPARERRRRPRHRRRHPVLPRGRDPELPVGKQAQTRTKGGRADAHRRAHRPAVGPGRTAGGFSATGASAGQSQPGD